MTVNQNLIPKAICLKMAILGTFLGLFIVLPLNLSASCSFDQYMFTCLQSNQTDYEVTTIESIPVLNITSSDDSWWTVVIMSSFNLYEGENRAYLGRLYGIVIVAWIMILYCTRVLEKEWVDALTLRRLFYLENSHWKNRIDEKKNTIERDDDDDDLKPGAIFKRRMINKGTKNGKSSKAKKLDIRKRPINIPHPEQRDTVPNIELYSVLVGNIPVAPAQIRGGTTQTGDLGQSIYKGDDVSLDWQLRVTVSIYVSYSNDHPFCCALTKLNLDYNFDRLVFSINVFLINLDFRHLWLQ